MPKYRVFNFRFFKVNIGVLRRIFACFTLDATSIIVIIIRVIDGFVVLM